MEYKRLGDIATYINGYPFKPEDRGSEGLPIIRIQDLTGNSYDLGFYSGEYPARIEVNDGDVLISWSASLGVYVWDQGKALLNQHIFKVVFDKEEVNKDFFVFAVRHKLKEMESKTHGATMKHIVKKDFDNTTIPFPSLEKQAEIADVLSKVENVIASRQQELSALDDLIKARFVEILQAVKSNAKVKLKEVVESERIITYGMVKPGPNVPDGVIIIKVKDFPNGVIETNDFLRADRELESRYARSRVKEGDLLFSIRGTVGRTAFVPIELVNANITQDTARLSVDRSRFDANFVRYALEYDDVQREIEAHIKGVAMRGISLAELREIHIPNIPLDIQKTFGAFVAQVDKSKYAVQKALDDTETLFDCLMQKYFG